VWSILVPSPPTSTRTHRPQVCTAVFLPFFSCSHFLSLSCSLLFSLSGDLFFSSLSLSLFCVSFFVFSLSLSLTLFCYLLSSNSQGSRTASDRSECAHRSEAGCHVGNAKQTGHFTEASRNRTQTTHAQRTTAGALQDQRVLVNAGARVRRETCSQGQGLSCGLPSGPDCRQHVLWWLSLS
jgi:hypothetical protein